MWYLITWHETDGNDCTVYDTVVQADCADDALTALDAAIEQQLTEQGNPYSSGGNLVDFYFDCDEDCPEDCEGHGGIALRTIESYPTEAEARKQVSKWHLVYTV
jgi:hypothetical protein